MKIKLALAGLLLMTGMAFGQSQFSGGGGGVQPSGSITPGNCASWVNGTTIQDAGTTCGGSGGAVSNQVQGQLPTTLGSATALNFSTPYEILVSAFCGSTTSCNPGGGIADESQAIRAIVTAYGCAAGSNVSCNIIDDMTGTQTWSEEPLPNSFIGRLDFKTTGTSHQVRLDGMSTWTIPSGVQVHGMGGSTSDLIGENTTIAACNPLTDNCVNGGFQVQNTSATTIGLSVSGSLMTVTLGAGAPFSITSTLVNQLVAGRLICIAGATGASNNNGCFTIASITNTTAPQVFVLNIDSTTQTTCASPCTAAVAYLNTPVVSIGTGGATGTYATRLGDFIIDGHLMIGTSCLADGQGEEGSGTDGHINCYNTPESGFHFEQSAIYGGPASSGTTNVGPFNSLSVNFNPFMVTLVGGANCSNTSIGTCNSSSKVPVGSGITCGAGTANFGVLTPNPCVNPNWTAMQLTGSIGTQGVGPILRFTGSCADKSESVATCIFVPSGASQPTGIVVMGIHASFGDIHTEFMENGWDICGDPAVNASLYETYGTTITSGVNWFAGGLIAFASGGKGIDIGFSGNGATCNDINIVGANIGNKTGSLIVDNVTSCTITGSATEQVETYLLGHGTPPARHSSSPQCSDQVGSITVGNIASASTPSGVINAGTGFQVAGAAASKATLCGNGTDFVSCVAGVVPNAQTGTTYTYSTSTDRAAYTSFSNASAIAITLPSAASLANNWVNVSCDIGAGTATITPATSTISYTNGATYTSAASTLALTTGQCAWIYSDNTNYFAIVRTGGTTLAESSLTGASAAATITEGAATASITRAGIATGNLTFPWVFQNTNSSNNNTSGGVLFSTPGTSTGQTNININCATTQASCLDVGTGGSVSAGVLSGQTNIFSLTPGGQLKLNAGNAVTAGTGAGFQLGACGTVPTGAASTSTAYCNASNFFDIMTATTDLGAAVAESSIIGANLIPKAIGTNPGVAASSITDNGTKVSSTEFLKMGNTQLLTANATPITATTPGTIVFTWGALPVSTNYSFHCAILYNQQTAAVLDGFSVQGATNAPTRLDAWGSMYTTDPTTGAVTGSQGSAQNITSTTATSVVTGTPGAITTVYQATLDGTVQGGASATTLNILMFTGNASDSVTPQAGSYCTLMP